MRFVFGWLGFFTESERNEESTILYILVLCSCVCLATEGIDGAIDTCVRQYCGEDELLQGIGCVPVPKRWEHLTYFPSECHDAEVWYICLSGFVHQNHFFTLTHPGKMRRSPRRFCKDTVVSSYSNVAETEMEAHGWENISTPVYPTTSLSATLETKITVCQ